MKSKQLYPDLSLHGGVVLYSIDHIDMLPAIFQAYQMSGVETVIFMYIFQRWNNDQRHYAPVVTTCKELSQYLHCAEISARIYLKRLVDNRLLLRERNIGVGAKYSYVPNQELIEELILKYQKLSDSLDKQRPPCNKHGGLAIL